MASMQPPVEVVTDHWRVYWMSYQDERMVSSCFLQTETPRESGRREMHQIYLAIGSLLYWQHRFEECIFGSHHIHWEMKKNKVIVSYRSMKITNDWRHL